jgi:deoxyribonuclease-4
MSPRRKPPLPPLGAHVSVAGGVANAIPRGEALGCTAVQIFVKNANRWQGPPIAAADAAAFREARSASPVGPVLAHASYLINLAAADPAILDRSRAALIDEHERCAQVGVDGLVLHPGSHLGAGEENGIERVAAEIDRALALVPEERPGGVRVLLENTAGQGSNLGWRLDHLAAIRSRLAAPERVAVCLDTCHAFAAGYPVHEAAGYEEFVAEADAVLGLGLVAAIHLNDSVKPFGSRRDRHAHIGEGEIGTDLFARLLHDRRFARVPMVLETEPGPDSEGHRRDLELLRSL